MAVLPRPSFRQLLLVAFLLVATLLGGVALRGQLTLESLLQRSRAGAERTLQLNGHAERLGETTLTMERAARQYLVLGDSTLRQTYERAAADATSHVQALADEAVAPEATRAWLAQRAWIDRELRERQLGGAEAVPGTRDRALAAAFRTLGELQQAMSEQLRGVTESRNAALQGELEAGRLALGRLVAGAVAFTLVLAFALALWLARPLRRVETAIQALGENRLDARIDIRGPADVRQIGRRLDWLRQRLAGIDADKARFLRHVSHELKTPLAALREGVALLQDGVAGPLSDNQREIARILHDNTATLQRRIEDLLQFNATAFAAQRLVRRPTEMGALVAALIEEQQLQWRARGVQVRLRCLPENGPEGGPITADVDAALLGSAIANLLSNAIRYSPAGTTITLTLSQQGDGLFVDVTDQGPGVPLAERERIFEPFFRGQHQPSDDLPGTGIGLSIVAEAVAAHGGRVQLLPDGRLNPGLNPGLNPEQPAAPGAHFRIELPHALAD